MSIGIYKWGWGDDSENVAFWGWIGGTAGAPIIMQAQRRTFTIDDQRRTFTIDDQRRTFTID